MAKKNLQAAAKKYLPMEDPPAESSSDDEEITDESSDEEDESQKQQNPSAPVSAAKEGSDSGESETEAESESETEPPRPPAATVSAKPKTKRPSEEASTSANVKRAKKDAKEETEPETETKKSYFQRLWSEEDEIVILKGMIDFKAETGKNPSENMNGFYESVKKSITYEAKNLNQFISKIHSLKKKFMAKKKKGEKLSFAKPHDEVCFELSKLIWDSDAGSKSAVGTSVVEKPKKKKEINVESKIKSGSDVESKSVVETPKKVNVESKKKVESLGTEGEDVDGNWFKSSSLVGSLASFGMEVESVKQKWSLVPIEVKKKIEEKWRVLERKQLEFASQKIAFVHDVASVLP